MKEIKDFRLFNKVVRKYWKRHAKKRSWIYEGKKRYFWEVWRAWCYYLSKDPEEWKTSIAHKYLSYEMEDERIPKFIEKSKSLLGKEIKVINGHGEVLVSSGIFYGLVFTNSGTLYAIMENKEIKTFYLSVELLYE